MGRQDPAKTALLVNADKSAPPKTSMYAFYVLAVLTVTYFTNQLDRLILPFIKTNMQEDIKFTNGQYGLLFGYGFSIIFVIVGLFAGPLADKYNRKIILFAGLITWSAATFATGYAKHFWELLVLRIMLGVGQSLCNPPAFSILSDYFAPERRPVANSVYTMGIYFGGGAASVLGGTLADSNFGWRETLRLLGYIGFGIAVLGLATVSEPIRGRFKPKNDENGPENDDLLSKNDDLLGENDDFTSKNGNGPRINREEPVSNEARVFTPLETVKYLMALGTPWKFFVSAGIRTMGGYSFGGFVPSYMKQSFPDNVPKLLVMYGIVTLVFGAAASFGGGALSKRFGAKNKKAPAYIGAIGAIVSLPFVFMIMFATKMTSSASTALAIAITGLAFEYLTAEVWGGPASAVVSNLLPAGMQGTGFAVYFSVSTLIGAGGPEILGLILQKFTDTSKVTDTKTYITAFMIVATYTISAAGFVLSMVSFEKDLRIKAHVETTGEIPPIPKARLTAFYIGSGCVICTTIVLVALSLAL